MEGATHLPWNELGAHCELNLVDLSLLEVCFSDIYNPWEQRNCTVKSSVLAQLITVTFFLCNVKVDKMLSEREADFSHGIQQ